MQSKPDAGMARGGLAKASAATAYGGGGGPQPVPGPGSFLCFWLSSLPSVLPSGPTAWFYTTPGHSVT